MKTNKKAILGFAIVMIFSLAIMQGISTKNSKQDFSMQQLGGAAAWGASQTEGGTSAVLTYTAGTLGATASGMAIAGAYAAVATTTNPVGWGYWAATAGVAL